MKVIIFGATGTIGHHVIEQAQGQPYEMTAFVRNPEKLAKYQATNLKIIQGDVFDYTAVEEAIQGKDVVICVLGGSGKSKVRSKGTQHIIQAMEVTGVKRLICQTTLGAGESRENLNFFWRDIMFGFFLKKVYKDHQLQEKLVKESNLDWTIVRPSGFTNGALTKNYQENFAPSVKNLKFQIARVDVAHFLLRQIKDNHYLQQAVSISH
ncbi:MAG: NAD(P)-dependent oxidoreductase [Thermonemataceae bacterium]